MGVSSSRLDQTAAGVPSGNGDKGPMGCLEIIWEETRRLAALYCHSEERWALHRWNIVLLGDLVPGSCQFLEVGEAETLKARSDAFQLQIAAIGLVGNDATSFGVVFKHRRDEPVKLRCRHEGNRLLDGLAYGGRR